MRFSSPEYSFRQNLRSKSLEPNNMDENEPKIKVPNYSTPVYKPEELNYESKIMKNQEPCTNKSIDKEDNQNYYNIRERTTPPTNQRTWPSPNNSTASPPFINNDRTRPMPNDRVVPTPPMNNDTNRPLPNNRTVPTPPMNNNTNRPLPNNRVVPTPPMNNDTNRPMPNDRVVPTPPMNNDTNRPLPNNRAVPTPPMNNNTNRPLPNNRAVPTPPMNNDTNRPLPNNRAFPTPPMNNDTNRPLPNNRAVPTPPMNNDTNRPLPNNRAVPTPPMNPNMPPGNTNEFNNPNFNVPGFENLYDLYSPPYNGPVGVPLMPLYGYDNSEDADKDWEYIRQMYPNTAKRILKEVENECDKLEYNGSCMFDEYPDKVYIGRIIDRIYLKMQDHIDGPIVYAENISSSLPCKEENEEIKDSIGEEEKIDSKIEKTEKDIEAKQYNRNRHNHQNQKTNWLKDLIEILFYQEILNRRRRYRSRNRWF